MRITAAQPEKWLEASPALSSILDAATTIELYVRPTPLRQATPRATVDYFTCDSQMTDSKHEGAVYLKDAAGLKTLLWRNMSQNDDIAPRQMARKDS